MINIRDASDNEIKYFSHIGRISKSTYISKNKIESRLNLFIFGKIFSITYKTIKR